MHDLNIPQKGLDCFKMNIPKEQFAKCKYGVYSKTRKTNKNNE